jgi:peptide/nickel transport system substrate-binding protein
MGSEPSSVDLNVAAYAGFSNYTGIGVMVNSGLSIVSPQGNAVPQLAEGVPSIDNGLWKLLPDGRMETSWRIRPGAQWHDSVPFTSADIAFTYQVEEDREVGIFQQAAYSGIDRVETPDASTVRVLWKRAYIYADLSFGYNQDRSMLPLPKHLLEDAYKTDKATFIDLPYWGAQFVGTGPYRIAQWVAGSHIIAEANDHYVLGRPKIDVIEVRFIPDPNALISNMLAGQVDVTLAPINLEQAREVTSRLPGAQMDLPFLGAVTAFPQFIGPNPAVVANPQFRRALMYGSDRQQMVETLTGGLSSVADTFLYPTDADFKDVESSIVKYDYDPRRAVQMIEGLGYTRGADGTFHDASGQPLSVELRASSRSYITSAEAIGGMWKQIGVTGVPYQVPPQLDGDAAFNAEYPAFQVLARGNYRWDLNRVLGTNQAPVPENRYFGGNRGRYQNGDLDAVIAKYDSTIPLVERNRYLAEIIHHVTDNLVLLTMYYNLNPAVYVARLHNVSSKWERSAHTWNVQDWEADY